MKNAEALVKKLVQGKGENDVPTALHGNTEATVLYNNLPAILEAIVPTNTAAEPVPGLGDKYLELALKLDKGIREKAWARDCRVFRGRRNCLRRRCGLFRCCSHRYPPWILLRGWYCSREVVTMDWALREHRQKSSWGCLSPAYPQKAIKARRALIFKGNFGVADGTRTHDNRNHNPGLYQLSYSHRSLSLYPDFMNRPVYAAPKSRP